MAWVTCEKCTLKSWDASVKTDTEIAVCASCDEHDAKMKLAAEQAAIELAGYAAERAAREARGESTAYVEDTTNADRAREVGREIEATYDPDLARQQSGPDPIEIESHWYEQ